MKFRTVAATAVLLWAATIWAQRPVSAAPALRRTPGRRVSVEAMTGDRDANWARMQSQEAQRRVQDMQATLTKMHALLKQMETRLAASKSPTEAAKDNVQMWTLMLGDLDRSFEELRSATQAQRDIEARRAAMYEQAAHRAAEEQQRATKANGGQDTTGTATTGTEGTGHPSSSPKPAAGVPPPRR